MALGLPAKMPLNLSAITDKMPAGTAACGPGAKLSAVHLLVQQVAFAEFDFASNSA
jgi:hypothetical protein